MTHSLEPSSTFGSDPVPATAWHWRMEDKAGAEVTSAEQSPQFPSQSDAESWVGEVWRDLLEAGVDGVTLLEGDRVVYGPMSLHS